MKTLTILSLLSLALTALALAQDVHATEPLELPQLPQRCEGFPDQAFNSRLGNEMSALVQQVRCKDLRGALREAQILQAEIQREVALTTEYGECYLDRKCTERASQTTPTKDMCKAADGKSWKRTNPTTGTCEAI
jgi:hypothetical protein